MHTSVRQISVSSGSFYFLRLDWSGHDLGSGFRLLMTDGQDAWKGEVSEAAVCDEAKELEMEKERYVQDLHQALTGTESSITYSFILAPASSSATVTLAYEKVQKDISFRLGSVVLRALSDPAEAVRELLIYSMDKGNSLDRHNRKLEQENQRLRQEHQRINAELKNYTSGKEDLEAELYSRFVLVLNEKKAKIRSLQQNLTQLQDERSSNGQSGTKTAKCDKAEEDDYGGSTDEEPEEAQPPPAVEDPTKERTTPSPLDDSLDDIPDVAPCRKRRFRHLGAPSPSAKQPKPQTTTKKRSESPAAASKEQIPQRSTDAVTASSEAEDLFDDF